MSFWTDSKPRAHQDIYQKSPFKSRTLSISPEERVKDEALRDQEKLESVSSGAEVL